MPTQYFIVQLPKKIYLEKIAFKRLKVMKLKPDLVFIRDSSKYETKGANLRLMTKLMQILIIKITASMIEISVF